MEADTELTDTNYVEETDSATAFGYSAGGAYSYWFNSGLALTGGAKYQNYAFDFKDTDGETVSMLYGKASYRF